ncbi:hypothetical protein GCM10010399_43990 [Dactylosporangium fulvum]|uniref:LexA repressor DNA-binding domain-containing protein n=1 Tax=Dactylosporangium fulvum TaxID=53359 RepID=A0ABY5WA84_9ACTN|nr:hypothetical protein [Dactylosporangium fulvum]UWP85934.1 hypothetical protein Dfulv_17445 [Dactylosporangium fulvum]
MSITAPRHAQRDCQRTAAVLAFIAEYQTRHGYGPSLREIAKGVGLSAAQSAQYHIDALVARRQITRTPGIARSIRTVAA